MTKAEKELLTATGEGNCPHCNFHSLVNAVGVNTCPHCHKKYISENGASISVNGGPEITDPATAQAAIMDVVKRGMGIDPGEDAPHELPDADDVAADIKSICERDYDLSALPADAQKEILDLEDEQRPLRLRRDDLNVKLILLKNDYKLVLKGYEDRIGEIDAKIKSYFAESGELLKRMEGEEE